MSINSTNKVNKMYEKSSVVTLVTTASAVNNNLVVKDLDKIDTGTAIGVIHEGYVNVISLLKFSEETDAIRDKYIPCIAPGTRPKRVTTVVTQVKWCTLGKRQYLIIASTLGIQLLDEDGRTVMYNHLCVDSNQHPVGNFARGLATMNDDLVFVGNSSGSLWVFRVLGENCDNVELLETRVAHPKAISDLATSKTVNLIASSDDSGSVILWKFLEKLQRIAAFENYSSPCTSLYLWHEAVICGYGSGHIRCFDSNNGHIIVEIGAHARTITALDVAENQGYILTVSEDSFAKVWQIDRSNYQIGYVATICVENCFLVGGQFLNNYGTEFCVATYDSNEVHCYSTTKLIG